MVTQKKKRLREMQSLIYKLSLPLLPVCTLITVSIS